MAAATTLRGMQEEATCPICLEHFVRPVITPCGHNFCLGCTLECLQGPGAVFSCPQCRQSCERTKLTPNRQLQSMVELLKTLSVQLEAPPRGEGLCVHHDEGLKLFCEDDNNLLCVVCQVSSEHQGHLVRPIGEAARDYQDRLQDWLTSLKKRRDANVVSKKKQEEKYKVMRNALEAEMRISAAEFERLRLLLREETQTALRRLEEMDRKITRTENANLSKLTDKISSLDSLIEEIETKHKQPPVELLKDIELTLSRCVHLWVDEPEEKKEEKMAEVRNITDLEIYDLPEEMEDFFLNQLFQEDVPVKRHKVLVTLDPETANQSLLLSENERRVRNLGTQQYRLFSSHFPWPNNPRTFAASSCVLGRQGFSSGKHYWDVQIVAEGLGWTMGVAQESVNRNVITYIPRKKDFFARFGPRRHSVNYGEIFPQSPSEGIWAVHGAHGEYFALTSSFAPLKPLQPPKKLGVYLDYEGGVVSVYNSDTMEVLYTFRGALFDGPVHPYFNLCSIKEAGQKRKGLTDLRLV